MYNLMNQFELWRTKQKLLDTLFWNVLSKKEKEQEWKNKELDWNTRFDLWMKGYAIFYQRRLDFHKKLRDEIFGNNNINLTEETAEKMF